MTKDHFIAEAKKNGFQEGNKKHLYKIMADGTTYRYKLEAKKVTQGVYHPDKGWFNWQEALYESIRINYIGFTGWKRIRYPEHEPV